LTGGHWNWGRQTVQLCGPPWCPRGQATINKRILSQETLSTYRNGRRRSATPASLSCPPVTASTICAWLGFSTLRHVLVTPGMKFALTSCAPHISGLSRCLPARSSVILNVRGSGGGPPHGPRKKSFLIRTSTAYAVDRDASATFTEMTDQSSVTDNGWVSDASRNHLLAFLNVVARIVVDRRHSFGRRVGCPFTRCWAGLYFFIRAAVTLCTDGPGRPGRCRVTTYGSNCTAGQALLES